MKPEAASGTARYEISDDPARLNLEMIHRYLSEESYWARGISRELVERSAAHSLCFGVYTGKEQAGLARVISDRATFAYLADVFILPEHRGQGLSKRLMATVTAHPELQNLRRWMLATADAHGLYRQQGFTALGNPERFMERREQSVYGGGA